MELENVRNSEFPALNNITFLDAACVSFAPKRTVDAVVDFVKYCARNDEETSTAHHLAMDGRREKAYEEAAKLLNADPEEIALVESTSHALNIAATSIPLEKGDKILTTGLEFLQVCMPWAMQRKTKEIEIVIVPGRDGKFEVCDFEQYCDDKVKIIVISSVEWCNGWKIDLKELGEFCRKKGIYFVVDAVQSMGIMKIDTKDIYVDFLAAGGHKWLNSPFGTGIMYVRKELIPKLTPAFWGYLNTKAPVGGWGAHFGNPSAEPVMDWEFMDDRARKFEIGGTTNYIGALALGESLAMVNEIGVENIEKYIMELRAYCYSELQKIGAHLVTHEDKGHESGTVVFRFYKSLEDEQKLIKFLHNNKVYVSLRFTSHVGGIRISCQYYIEKKDIDRLIEVLKMAAEEKLPDYDK